MKAPPSNVKDLSGQKFNKLTVISFAGIKRNLATWNCLCDCGATTVKVGCEMVRGKVGSCGCLRRPQAASLGFKEGMSEHPLYNVWRGMVERCKNKKADNYSYYGGRGISVCQEWANTSYGFIKWALSNGWSPGLKIDRKDNYKGYSPENCRFVTHSQNCRNKRLLSKTNNTGFSGIVKDGKKYKVDVRVKGHRYYLGMFSDPVSAAISRDWFMMSMSKTIHLNFPILHRL